MSLFGPLRLRLPHIATMLGMAMLVCGCSDMQRDVRVDGIVWQTDLATARPSGSWQLLGVHDLLIQWIVVDGRAFVPVPGLETAEPRPDFAGIGREPWARNVILGLAGYADEKRARANVGKLAELSARLARTSLPLHVTGYYFPVEIDPTWSDAPQIARVLNTLPRPLWVTVYDSANVGGKTLADWLASWLPVDVGIFFQDGCGVHAREPTVAREYADALTGRLGKARVRIIAEAFRPGEHGGFRSATEAEMRAQLAHYHGYSVYLFDGPHYVSEQLIRGLAPRAWQRRDASR